LRSRAGSFVAGVRNIGEGPNMFIIETAYPLLAPVSELAFDLSWCFLDF
jgi:hypothetical protein